MSSARPLLCAVIIVLAGCSGAGGGADGAATASPVDSTPVAESGAPGDATPDGTLEVHNINVGQSVSTLVVAPSGETMLIDTGHFRDDGEHVLQYLRAHDISRIDHLVVSHNDADHIGGNAAAWSTTPASPPARRPTARTSTPSRPTTSA
jgi:competence protein ComEC